MQCIVLWCSKAMRPGSIPHTRKIFCSRALKSHQTPCIMAQVVPMHLPDPFPADEGQPNDRAIMEDFLQELASGE